MSQAMLTHSVTKVDSSLKPDKKYDYNLCIVCIVLFTTIVFTAHYSIDCILQ